MKLIRYGVGSLSLVFSLFFGWILVSLTEFAITEGYVLTREFAYVIWVYGIGFAASVFGLVRCTFHTAKPPGPVMT